MYCGSRIFPTLEETAPGGTARCGGRRAELELQTGHFIRMIFLASKHRQTEETGYLTIT
jgi:hypothetical protein